MTASPLKRAPHRLQMGFKLSSDQLENRLAVSAGSCWRLSPAKLKNAHEEKKKKHTPDWRGEGQGGF